MENKALQDIVKTREILKNKIKNIKAITENRLNVLEDTFQPITKPLNFIVDNLKNLSQKGNSKKSNINLNIQDNSVKKAEVENEHDANETNNVNYINDYNDDDDGVYDNFDDTGHMSIDNVENEIKNHKRKIIDVDEGEDDDDDNNERYIKRPKLSKQKSKSSVSKLLLNNLKILKDNKQLDTLYGCHVDRNGNWRYGSKRLKFDSNKAIFFGNKKWILTPGLFELIFHSKPKHYSEKDLESYKDILLDTNAHKRYYLPNSQIKGTNSFKYQHVLKNLFKGEKTGRGLTLKTLNKNKPDYIYWDDPNELVHRLRILISSESAGHNNHKNEIISIVEELKEAKVIKYRCIQSINLEKVL